MKEYSNEYFKKNKEKEALEYFLEAYTNITGVYIILKVDHLSVEKYTTILR